MEITKKNKKIITYTIVFLMLFMAINLFRYSAADSYLKKAEKDKNAHNYKNALLNYEKSSALTPENDTIAIKAGDLYLSLNDYKNAEIQYAKAYNKNSNSLENNKRIINIYLKNGKLKNAIEKIFLSRDRFVKDTSFSLLSAKVLASSGKINKALDKIENQNDRDSIFYKSVFYAALGDFEKAKLELSRINIDKNDSFTIALNKIEKSNNEQYKKLILAQSFNEIGEPYLAEKILKSLEDSNHSYRDYYVYLGYTYYLESNYAQAKEQLNKAVELDPIFGQSYYYLGLVSLSEGKHKEAYDFIKKSADNGYDNASLEQTLKDLESKK